MKIAVLMGGTSEEREISIRTGAGVSKALLKLGHEVITLDTGTGALLKGGDLRQALGNPAGPSALAPTAIPKGAANVGLEPFVRGMPRDVDLVFVALHGGDGENGTLQALLDLARVPYTGSGVLASALAMQKDVAKELFRVAGVPVAEGLVASRFEAAKQHLMARPYVIKPIAEGSSDMS